MIRRRGRLASLAAATASLAGCSQSTGGFVFIRDGEVVATNSGTISYATAESLLDL